MDPRGFVAWRVAPRISQRLHQRILWTDPREQSLGRSLVDRCVERHSFVIDVGANCGLYAARLAYRVGAKGSVLAFEPNPAHAVALAALARELSQLRVCMAGLSDRPGTITLRIPRVGQEECHWLASLEQRSVSSAETERLVPITTLDSELAGVVRPPSFIKCDVEGHEHQVLAGARQVIARTHPSLLIEIEQRHRELPVEDTFQVLLEWGYRGWAIGQDRLMPLEDFDLRRDQTAFVETGTVSSHVVPDGYVNEFFFASRDSPHARVAEELTV